MTKSSSFIKTSVDALQAFLTSSGITEKDTQNLQKLCDRVIVAGNNVPEGVSKEIWRFYTTYMAIEGIKINSADPAIQQLVLKRENIAFLISLTTALEKHEGKSTVDPNSMPFQYSK